MMNSKGYERKQSWPNKLPSQHLPGGTEETHVKSTLSYSWRQHIHARSTRHVQTHFVSLHSYTLWWHQPALLAFHKKSECQLLHHYAQRHLLDMQPFALRREMSCLHFQTVECVTSHIPISTKLSTLERHPTRLWEASGLRVSNVSSLCTHFLTGWYIF
jgi:hypothetical protein